FAKRLETLIPEIFKKFCVNRGFLTVVDIENNRNIFFCLNESIQDDLSKALGVTWNAGFAQTQKIYMRKEIVPLLKDVLE
ncbi:MAG: hypothetical protein ABIH21_04055, partial [Patescibacteria group bacterium]